MTQIFFGGPAGGLKRFPEPQELAQRFRSGTPIPLAEFIEDIRVARDVLWILDQHFDEVGVVPLADALADSAVREVRILTRSTNDEPPPILETARRVAGFTKDLGLFWCRHLEGDRFPYAHDRFAIADEKLWHFGHTVGGGGRAMTAMTGAWDAVLTEAQRFFRQAWDAVSPPEQKIARDRM